MNEDIDLLQREKVECLERVREFQEQMHEAMQRALDLEKCNRSLQKQLDELKEAALLVETEANNEISQREAEVEMLKAQLKQMQGKCKLIAGVEKVKVDNRKDKERGHGDCNKASVSGLDKHRFNEKINELTQKGIIFCSNINF